MSMISSRQLQEIAAYLRRNARAVDLARFNFHFCNGDTSDVLAALAPYQNEDGGYGKAIEPDLRLPQSTAIGTLAAFQCIGEAAPDPANEILTRGLNYFISTYDRARNGWAIIRPEADGHPHAPWWDYAGAMNHFGWGNPSAEILGLLIKYRHVVDAGSIIDAVKERACARINEIDPSSFHEVLNFNALYCHADDELKSKLEDPLRQLVRNAACTSPDEWKSYVAPPLKFIASPDDPFIDLFMAELIEKNLEFIAGGIVGGDHWEPNWDWGDCYPEAWATAKQEWSGYITVANLLTLKNFGAV